ncbi:hypothetical protein [Nostoc sp. CENA543]|uniref:hypothetical protein n=1 Tax=Nostoc sp. CENA543 TaxID=1869241 RepID=UPI001300141D|nr:hypothetical protein [Nostoc sp. CENA543]
MRYQTGLGFAGHTAGDRMKTLYYCLGIASGCNFNCQISNILQFDSCKHRKCEWCG